MSNSLDFERLREAAGLEAIEASSAAEIAREMQMDTRRLFLS